MRGKTISGCAMMLLAGCVTAPGEQRTNLNVTMTGLQEVPGPGDPDGSGTAEIRVDPRAGRVCWNLYARQIDAATAAHIHRGAAGVAGPPVVTLTTPGADGHSEGCAPVDAATAREMVMEFQDFYVNVHTRTHASGAIRGQMRGPIRPRRRQED